MCIYIYIYVLVFVPRLFAPIATAAAAATAAAYTLSAALAAPQRCQRLRCSPSSSARSLDTHVLTGLRAPPVACVQQRDGRRRPPSATAGCRDANLFDGIFGIFIIGIYIYFAE